MQKSRNVKKNFVSCHHGGKYSAKNHQMVKIDFSSNINPLGISQKVIESLKENIGISCLYPDPNCIKLKQDILEYLDSNIEQIENIIVGNGATELIHYFSSVFTKKKVLIPSPTFCEYELASKRNSADIIDVPYKKNFDIDEEQIIKKINSADNQISSMFICNPNNPTGKNSRKQIIEILEKNNNKDLTIMLDESYIEFTDSKEEKNNNYFINIVKEYDNLVILRSLTKSFGLAGLRVGYAVANKKKIFKMNHKLIAWNVNGLAQIAASEALKDKEHLKNAKKMIEKEKKRIFNILRKNKSIKTKDSDVNFYLFEVLGKMNSSELAGKLLNRNNLLVRDCKTFTGMNDRFIRASIKTPKENNELVYALGSSL